MRKMVARRDREREESTKLQQILLLTNIEVRVPEIKGSKKKSDLPQKSKKETFFNAWTLPTMSSNILSSVPFS